MSNQPAFPTPVCATGFKVEASDELGMSLRDYFAAKALQGLMSRAWGDTNDADKLFKIWAASAYGLADAMLKARQA